MSQQAIDNVFGTLRTAPADLPKGLSPDTLYVVERTLLEANRQMTSEEVAHLSGVSRVTARRYLRFLVEAERATAASEYGSPGRPKHLYVALRSPGSDQ